MPYSVQLFGGEFGAGSSTLYTVPANYVAVIRDIRLYGAISADAEIAIEVTVPGPLSVPILFEASFAPGATLQQDGRVVLPAGQTIVGVSTEASIQAIISGYLVSAP